MDIFVEVNFLAIIVEIVLFLGGFYGLGKAIIQKKPLGIIFSLCFLLFNVFMASAIHLGGTPAPEAVTEYELYEAGHYYLVSHGDYRDVSYDIYRYMQVMEIVGWISFAISFVLALINNKIETGSFFGKR